MKDYNGIIGYILKFMPKTSAIFLEYQVYFWNNYTPAAQQFFSLIANLVSCLWASNKDIQSSSQNKEKNLNLPHKENGYKE